MGTDSHLIAISLYGVLSSNLQPYSCDFHIWKSLPGRRRLVACFNAIQLVLSVNWNLTSEAEQIA